MESATKEDRSHPENNFCNEFKPYLSTDDQVFKGEIVAYTRDQKDRSSLAMPHSDRALWHLINLGAQDCSSFGSLFTKVKPIGLGSIAKAEANFFCKSARHSCFYKNPPGL